MELTPFNDFETHIAEETDKQTNKQTEMVSAFKVPKGETRSMGHCHCSLTSGHESKQVPGGAREALHPAWDQMILHASFHILIYKLVYKIDLEVSSCYIDLP